MAKYIINSIIVTSLAYDVWVITIIALANAIIIVVSTIITVITVVVNSYAECIT